MKSGGDSEKMLSPSHTCQLVVRQHEGPAEFLRFIQEGLEVGQQVVALAGAGCLTNVARALNSGGLQAQSLLRSGRLVFLTAGDCLEQLRKPDGPVQRALLRRHSPLVRWVSDWSWAYSSGLPAKLLLDYQHRIHDLVRCPETLSLCTVHSSALQRGSLLALLADHRRAVRGRPAASRDGQFAVAALSQ
jgi:hypothetical protein